MKKINHRRLLCICMAIAMMVSMFAVTASAASYSTYVAGNGTTYAGSPYLYQDAYTVKVTNSGTFNCTVWFQKGSDFIGPKVLFYKNATEYTTAWYPRVSTAATYDFYVSNNANAGQTFYTSITRGY